MIVAVVGTGTGVGKTTTSAALIRSFVARGRRVVGWKPIETGGDADERALADASGVVVAASFRAAMPIAPALAGEGAEPDLEAIADRCRSLAEGVEILVVETAGGLFSPVRGRETNAEMLDRIAPDRVVLVAANRLGVLHGVESVRRASPGRSMDVVVLTGGFAGDLSCRTNAGFLRGRFASVVELPEVGSDAGPVADALLG